MPEIRGVLWDMDGTLVDSEELHWRSWRDTMASEGLVITRDQFRVTFGQRNDAIIPRFLGAASPERIARIGDAKEALYRKLVRENGVAALPGVAGWVWRLNKQGWRQAVASSAPRLNVEVVLDVLGFTDCFQGIVSAEDVQRGKPDPEVFLAAAARIGIAPEWCLVVEDAAAGVEAGRRAGMRTIGVSRDAQTLAADVTVALLDLLAPDAFEKLIGGNGA